MSSLNGEPEFYMEFHEWNQLQTNISNLFPFILKNVILHKTTQKHKLVQKTFFIIQLTNGMCQVTSVLFNI